MMITKFESYLITENPDTIKDGRKILYFWKAYDAVPFLFNVNKDHTKATRSYIGDTQDTHYNIDTRGSGTEAYPGRLWLNEKIMSFWVYPNEKLFTSMIKKLENKMKIKIFNNGWRLEVVKNKNKNKNEIIRKKFNSKEDEDEYFGDPETRYRWRRSEIIPLDNYVGSEDQPEEQRIMHMMNWKEKALAKKHGELDIKGWGSDKTAWDSPHNLPWRQAIYQEKKNNENYLITESPDRIEFTNKKGQCDELPWYNGRAKAFFIEVNEDHTKVKKLYVSAQRKMHSDIKYDCDYSERSYPGRLWLDKKIMSFWVYPNEKLFVDIIHKLEEKIKIKIFNNDWRIEVIIKNDEIKKTEFDPDDDDKYFRPSDRYRSQKNYGIIPIEDYVGSENQPEELRIMHMMNWKEKALAKKQGKLDIKGWGSDKTAWDSPHNLPYRQAIYQEKKNNNDNNI